MTQPTDADRQRARKVAHAIQRLTPDGVYCSPIGHTRTCDLFADLIAAAIAAARAEALEEAAKLMMDIYCLPGCASAIRALKEPGHG